MSAWPGAADTGRMEGDDEDGLRSERDVMDGLRVLKARSGLSYRDIAARMLRSDPRHAVARSTLASLLAGNSLPRRPGQLAALVEVLAAELNEPGQIPRYVRAWSRLIAARSEAQPPATSAPTRPDPLVPRVPAAARPAAPAMMRPTRPLGAGTAPPPESPLSGRQMGAFFFWLALLTVIAFVMWGAVPPGVVPFWLVWLVNVSPLLLAALVNWLARDSGRRPGHLSDAPAEYLRTEFRSSHPAAGPRLSGRWPS
jgi:hypothetical protein